MSPYELVQSEKAEFPVGVLCEAVGVSRSAYYAWCRGTPSQRKLAAILGKIVRAGCKAPPVAELWTAQLVVHVDVRTGRLRIPT